MTMPGRGKTPGGQDIDINETGEIVGMFQLTRLPAILISAFDGTSA